ncbi:flagellar hook-associated protein FlgK [Pigmentiphaga aceris]|nr:flagellar hook-associated protein FlgK [Pigmentiphaga aceris]
MGSALSGLNAAQASLATVSHNIANVNTPGYTRQEVAQTSTLGQYTGAGFIGNGVQVTLVRRIYDEFLTNQATRAQSQSSYHDSYDASMTQLMNTLGDAKTGVNVSVDKFFTSMQDFSARIGEPAARQTALSSAEAMAARFRTASDALDSLRNGANQQIATDVAAINQLSQGIGQLNERIGIAQGTASGNQPNDLLDQRDALVRELNKLVGVSTTVQDGTSLNVFLSSGQPLVVGNIVSSLVSTDDPNSLNGARLELKTNGNNVVLREDDVSGGDLGATLSFRNNELAKSQDDLGKIAITLAAALNKQNQFGLDANGDQGKALFTVGPPLAYGAKSNAAASKLDVSIADTRNMVASDYAVSFDGTNYSVRRLSDNNTTTIPTGSLAADGTFTVDGLKVKPTMASGDTFTINPSRQAAAGLNVLLKDSKNLAGAAPMALVNGTANTGSAVVSRLTSSGQGTPNFNNSITVKFAANGAYELFDAGTEAAPNVPPVSVGTGTYTGPNGKIAHNGWSFEVSTTPAAGDEFTVKAGATDPTGDNRNATAMASLTSAKLLNGSTLTQNYAVLVSDMGSRANEITAGKAAYGVILSQAIVEEQSAAGVNLDEEAAKLLRFQQAYAASGKVLAIASSLFDTILAALN